MRISRQGKIVAALLGLAIAVLAAVPASAAEPYEFDPTLSLLGSCEELPGVDPVKDPGCPYPPPPNGPSGRFVEPRAIAVDLSGNQYIASFELGNKAKGRVDVFDDEGRFITEFVAPEAQSAAVDSKGNLYVYRDFGELMRYEPTKYEPEDGVMEYGKAPILVGEFPSVGTVAVDTDPGHLDQVLVARDTISRYKSAAEGNGLIETYEPVGLAWTEAMAIDSQRRRLFVSSCKKGNEECGVRILDADDPDKDLAPSLQGSTPAKNFAAFSGRLPLAVDETSGALFVGDPSPKRIYQFSEAYELLSELEVKEFEIGAQIAISNGTRDPGAEPCKYPNSPPPPAGDACNRHYLFVPNFKSSGRVGAYHPPGQTPPVIEAVSTLGIGETEAELSATIFPGGVETEYHFEITTQTAWEAEIEKFEDATIVPGGTISADSLVTEVSSFATGLTPGETYRFRAVAENGKGKAKEEGQNEATFTTYSDADISTVGSCPNEALRVKASALLPDCRAYELVSPADTSGRPPKGTGFLGSVFSTLQASPAGEAVSFKIDGGSLPEGSGIGSFEGDPYVSRRGATGWSTELAGATGAEATKSAPASVSPDQGYAFWRARGEGPLVTEPIVNEYLHYPDGHSEAIGRGSEGSEPRAKGRLITENASHVIFQSINLAPKKAVKLEPNAPPEGTEAVYDRTISPSGVEKTHVVSLLPGDVTPKAGENANYEGASKDGEGIAFSIGKETFSLGTLYFRVGNETTYEVGKEVEFAGISEGGERIFYVEGGNLEALDTTGSTPKVVDFATTGNAIPVNVSSDGSRAYFVSPSVLGGPNPEGDSAQAGKQNLYLSEEGTISFVATVTDRDVEGEPEPLGPFFHDGLGLWTKVAGTQPARDPSRLNPDGSVLLFQSRAEITGYPESEFPQVYRFDSDKGDLQCISCIPTGVKATGGASLESYGFDSFAPNPFSPYGFVPNLTPAGTRVFFDSTEALVSTDTDEVNDVYEWEANGVGSCKQPEGCVYLISSGQSQKANYLYGHSTDGRDVFFTTADTLTGWDSAGGALSIYDARVNGGFPEPNTEDECIGDGCRPSVSPAPVLPSPAVPARGADDQVRAKHCPKGKHKVKKNGKVRCVKKKQSKKHKGKGGKAKQRAGADRGAGK